MLGEINLIIGVDNGISGGLVALSIFGSIVAKLPMPIQKARKGNEIDILTVWEWVESLQPDRTKYAITIEEPGGSKSANAAASMSGSFHALRAMCALKKLRWYRITPQSWQKKMLPDCKAGDTKPRALALSRQLWPTEDFKATPHCRTPHDGLIDAALIAEYTRKHLL